MMDIYKGENARRYFETRLPQERWSGRAQVSIHCPFHADANASMSVNVDEGVWTCHSACGSGGVLAFEMRFSKCDRDIALDNICRILGVRRTLAPASSRSPSAIYEYPNALGADVVQKLRLNREDGSKYFVWRRPDGKGGHVSGLPEGFRKRLYRLPELVRASFVIVVEGEKDADRVSEVLAHVPHLAVTTSPDGASKAGLASKWLPEYGPYFTGKTVAVIGDNDEAGRSHAEAAAANIFPFAAGIKLVMLPGLQEHGDASDFLECHSADELLSEIKKAAPWKPAAASAGHGLSVPAPQFWCSAQGEISYFVEPVIQRGGNGFVCAAPKGAKSWVSVDLAISLALGCPWLGFKVPQPVKGAARLS